MTTSQTCEKSKKLLFKFSLALLIAVINFVSTKVSANELFERKLAAICREKIGESSGYERTHRKCFVARPNWITWQDADSACKQLPHLEHFGPPTLATIDLGNNEMAGWAKDTMGGKTCKGIGRHNHLWTGGYIPFGDQHHDKKDNSKWRWMADGSKLSASHPAWQGSPNDAPSYVCAVFDCNPPAGVGLWDTECTWKRPTLCQYEADDPKICWYPPVPQNAQVSKKNKIKHEWGITVTVRCNSGYVVKGTKYRTEQVIMCEFGKWMKPLDCVKSS